jgi:hypothetical protein
MKTVTVKFADTATEYDYFVDDTTVVAEGDLAIVHTGARGGFKIVFVTKVRNGSFSKQATKTLVKVVTRADMDTYKAFNDTIALNRAKIERLDEIMAAEYENNKYRVLANSNAEAAALAKELGLI